MVHAKKGIRYEMNEKNEWVRKSGARHHHRISSTRGRRKSKSGESNP